MFQQVVLFHGIRKLIKAIRCRGSIVFGVGGSSTTERQQRRDSNTGRLLSAVFAKIQIEIQIELQIQIQETAPLLAGCCLLPQAASAVFAKSWFMISVLIAAPLIYQQLNDVQTKCPFVEMSRLMIEKASKLLFTKRETQKIFGGVGWRL